MQKTGELLDIEQLKTRLETYIGPEQTLLFIQSHMPLVLQSSSSFPLAMEDRLHRHEDVKVKQFSCQDLHECLSV